jgi:hypothetical protein
MMEESSSSEEKKGHSFPIRVYLNPKLAFLPLGSIEGARRPI